jgi:hypothetical protein
MSPLQGTIAGLSLLFMISIWVGVVRTGISPMPSSRGAIREILNFIPKTGKGPIIELGSGWGTLAIPLARAHPQRQIICYELSSIPWLFLRLSAVLLRLHNIETHHKSFQDADLSSAAVVVCYLFPQGMTLLAPKLESELAPKAIIVSNTFALPGWKPAQEVRLQDMYRTPIYQYTVPKQRLNVIE